MSRARSAIKIPPTEVESRSRRKRLIGCGGSSRDVLPYRGRFVIFQLSPVQTKGRNAAVAGSSKSRADSGFDGNVGRREFEMILRI